jgi:hypothetical protein
MNSFLGRGQLGACCQSACDELKRSVAQSRNPRSHSSAKLKYHLGSHSCPCLLTLCQFAQTPAIA